MDVGIRKLDKIPDILKEIPEPPKNLYIRGEFPEIDNYIFLTIIGSRKQTSYGKAVIEKLVNALRGHFVIIVSGLALGTDTSAHELAIKNNLKTIAVPGSGLSRKVLYPRSNLSLVKKIIESGGCILSEFENEQKAAPWTFPKRNRIMAGLSEYILIIEAEEKSGTLITARLGLDYNKNILCVPGSIFSGTSKGTNRLIKEGATPISSPDDLLEALSLKKDEKKIETSNLNEDEIHIIEYLTEPRTREEISEALNIPIHRVNISLSILEIQGLIKESIGQIWRL